MATQMKADSVIEDTVMGADLVTGAAVTAADGIARVVNHPVREAHKIERRGAAANRKLSRDLNGMVEDAGDRIEAMMPEKVALAGIHVVKARARRKDLVGEVAYQALRVVNGGLEAVLGTVSRLEKATEPPARTPSAQTRKATRPVRKAARTAKRTAGTAKRTAGTAARRTTTRVRRSTARARRTERATA